jgi:hypothetical protein
LREAVVSFLSLTGGVLIFSILSTLLVRHGMTDAPCLAISAASAGLLCATALVSMLRPLARRDKRPHLAPKVIIPFTRGPHLAQKVIISFTILTGVSSLVSAVESFHMRIGFYVAALPLVLFGLWTAMVYYQEHRVGRLKSLASVFLADAIRNTGPEAVPQIVAVAGRPGMREPVVEILSDAAQANPDPTERLWIYYALSQIRGPGAMRVIERAAATECDKLPREAAERYLDSMRQNEKKTLP